MTGYVYAIDNGRGFVKIGWAKSPERRLSEINVSDVSKLRLVGYVAGTREHEAAMHQILAPWRERGEWFRLDGHVRTFVELISAGFEPRTRGRSRTGASMIGMSDTRKLIIDAIEMLGSQAKLGAAAGLSQNAVWSAKRTGKVSAKMAKGIETATRGKIPSWKLRPDLWEPPVRSAAKTAEASA